MEWPSSTTLNPLCIVDQEKTAMFVIVEHAVFGFSVPLNLVMLWCIYSDKSNRIKWYLFNCQLWFLYNDASFAILSTAVILLPIPAYYSYGILNYTGLSMRLQLYLGIASVTGVFASIIHLFFHRHQTILPKYHKRHLRKEIRIAAVIFFYIFYGGGVIVLHFLLAGDKAQSLKDYEKILHLLFLVYHKLQKYPCLFLKLYDDETVILASGNVIYSIGYISFFIASWLIIVICLVTDSFYSIQTEQQMMSKATKDQVRRSLTTIVIQLSVMFTFIVTPVIVNLYQMLALNYDHTLSSVGVLFVSFHASAGTLTGICLNKKYRSLLRQKLSCFPGHLNHGVWFTQVKSSRSGGH